MKELNMKEVEIVSGGHIDPPGSCGYVMTSDGKGCTEVGMPDFGFPGTSNPGGCFPDTLIWYYR